MKKFHALEVAEHLADADDAVAISFAVPEGLRAEFRGLPGQHVVLRALHDGEEIRRTYSLVNAPGEWPMRIVARIHEPGRMSSHLSRDVRVGDRVEVLPPNGSLTPRRIREERRTWVAFASGCGITPIVSIASALLQERADSRFILFYGNTSAARAMCLEELLGLKDRYLNRLALHFLMSREPQEVELYNGRLDEERTVQLASSLFQPAEVAEYFVCGPGDMIERVAAALRGLGVEAGRIHGEHFSAAPDDQRLLSSVESPAAAASRDAPTKGIDTSIAAESTAAGADPNLPPEPDTTQVTVVIDGRRRSFAMRMNGEILLEAAERAGLDLPFSCRAGVCSTCRTKVIRGAVEMAQNYALEEWELEQGYVLACQSRVTTPELEVDYDEK